MCLYCVTRKTQKKDFFSCSGFWDASYGQSGVTQRDAGKRRRVKGILLRKRLARSDALSENTALSPGVKVGAEQ